MAYTDDGFFYFNYGVSDSVKKRCNAQYVAKKKMWRIPYLPSALRELYSHSYMDSIIAHGKECVQWHRDLQLLKTKALEGVGLLRSYQVNDIAFLSSITHAAIFNEQRTGKTVTALMTVSEYEKGIIICPSSLKFNWENEVRKWTSFNVTVVSGTKKQRHEQIETFNDSLEKHILIISYESLRLDVHNIYSVNLQFAIADEAHRLRNEKSIQSKVVQQVSKDCLKRLALTGTPTFNHPSEVFGILRYLYPTRFTSKWGFFERYFNVKDGKFGKVLGNAKRGKELQELLQSISVQRKRSELGMFNDTNEHVIIPLEMTKIQQKHYDEMYEYFESDEVVASTVLSQLTRLRQICTDPSILFPISIGSCKTDFLIDYLTSQAIEGTLIFCTFSTYLKMLSELLRIKGIKHGLIIGETSIEDRQAYVDDFQNGKVNVLLLNIQAGGVGFTLDRANVSIFVNRDYVPALNEQAQDRMVSTKGQKSTKTIIDLVAKDSVEERILELLNYKKSITAIVNEYGKQFLLK